MKKFVIVVIVLALVGAGVFWAMAQGDDDSNGATNNGSTAETPGSTEEDDEDDEGEVTTIVYSETGFSPSNITVDSGTTVTVVNNSPDSLELASDPHPTHTDNPELNYGIIPSGETATLTLTTTGSWGFHNHLNETLTGQITVR